MSPDVQSLLRSAYDKRKAGNSVAALALARQALDHADRDDRAALARVLCAIGQFHRDLGAIRPARDAYAEAVGHIAETGDRLYSAHALRHLGDLERELGHLDAAREKLEQALKIYATEGGADGLARANADRVLALVHEARGDRDQAHDCWRSARAIYAALDIAAGVAECDTRLAG